MEWGPSPRLMVAVCPDGVNACRKTLLQQRFRDNYIVIQAGVDKVIVENMETCESVAPGKLQLAMQLKGLDVSRGVLLAFDGVRVETYKVSLECCCFCRL